MEARITPYILLVLTSIFAAIFADEFVTKLQHGGEIRGNTLKSQTGRTIYAYRGIPYAEPPTGALRFKAPVRKSPWKGQTIPATKDGPPCAQYDFVKSAIGGQEDCLYLNVYTTKSPKEIHGVDKLAVMVFIHGGAFIFGSSSSEMYGPGLLLDKDVILVTMNYRLGPFGFLSTGDTAASGNYGLMDQNLALEWVKIHIYAFGGDEDKITIFGESAGAASVGYQLISPISKGLFNAVIAQSGTPLSGWALQKNPAYWTKVLASDLECPTESTTEMIECLKAIPAIDILKMLNSQQASNKAIRSSFVPTVDGTFISMEPKKILSSGNIPHVPYLGGVNKDEGLISYVSMQFNTVPDPKSVAEAALIKLFSGYRKAKEVTKLIMEKYFSQLDWTDKDAARRAIIKLFSDRHFNIPHYETLKLLSQNGISTYTYSLDYIPSVSILNRLGIKEKWGVAHADDLGFLFDGPKWILKNSTADDRKIMKVMCTAWANFAKHHDPTPILNPESPLNWEPSGNSEMQVYHIDNPVTASSILLDKDDLYKFWTEVIPNLLNRSIPNWYFYKDIETLS